MALTKKTVVAIECDIHGSEGFEGDEIQWRVAEDEKEAREVVELCGGRIEPDGRVLCSTCIEESEAKV